MTDLQKDKNSNSRPWINILILLVSLIGVIIAYLVYNYNVQNDAPSLRVLGHPRLVRAWWAIPPPDIPNGPVLNLGTNSSHNPLPVFLEPESLKIELRLTNIGKRVSHIFGYVLYDTVSMEPILRERILNLRLTDTTYLNKPASNLPELATSDTITVTLTHVLWNLSGSDMILHDLILYDDGSNVYDVYYQAQYQVSGFNIYNDIEPFHFVRDQRLYNTYTGQHSTYLDELAKRLQQVNHK